jgi:hypothetical protein
MPFSKAGAGHLLGDLFDREVSEHLSAPHAASGTTLLMAADFAGSHAGQLFETYSFLFMELEANREWLASQAAFRRSTLRSNRRIAFKALNDKVRRAAMPAFLAMGSEIQGSLITFAISRNRASIFEVGEPASFESELLASWQKMHIRERLLRVLHLSAFLLSGLSAPGQNILWVTDEDEIASNVDQLTALTKVFNVIASNSLSHNLGHLRCATAKSDDGSRTIEDALAYADLAAGAVSELVTAMQGGHKNLQKHVVSPVPPGLSWKATGIGQWLAESTGSLKRHICLMDLRPNAPGMVVSMLRLHAHEMPQRQILPP